MFLAKTLTWYKRRDVQEAITEQAENKEVGVRYGNGFGKRPDVIMHERDILEFAKRKSTSFHFSEELWHNPLRLKPGMTLQEARDQRKGWDFILDVDCKFWVFAKLATNLFVKALLEHGLKPEAVTVKFSGNKGFHIAVPFEAFPPEIHGEPTKDWFPEGPKRLAQYLLDYVTKHYVHATESLEFGGKKISAAQFQKITGQTLESFTKEQCVDCHHPRKSDSRTEFVCPACQYRSKSEAEFLNCEKCNSLMNRYETDLKCPHCGATRTELVFDPSTLLDLDTLLISSRHLYRAPYSFHEKSELVSLPIPLNEILSFEKEKATPDNADFTIPFMKRDIEEGQANRLIRAAFDHAPTIQQDEQTKKVFEVPKEAIPEEYFPPCMKNLLNGLEDGKKRALFILVNFLKAAGWNKDMIDKRVHEWNKKNPEPLRETNVKGHLRYHTAKKETPPPPNCRKYYEELRICQPDQTCMKIKNPLQYAKRKAKYAPKKKKPKKAKEEVNA